MPRFTPKTVRYQVIFFVVFHQLSRQSLTLSLPLRDLHDSGANSTFFGHTLVLNTDILGDLLSYGVHLDLFQGQRTVVAML